MKAIYEQIQIRTEQFARLPIFEFLKDRDISARERLALAPQLAFFVMSFGDFNRLWIRNLASQDELQAMINRHSYEDESHWRWLLEDMKALGLDGNASFTEHAAFLWGPETERSRLLTYRLCGLTYNVDPRITLAVIEALERTGRIFFDHATRVAAELREEEGVDLRYFGHVHLGEELGHVANEEGLSHKLAKLEIDDALRQKALAAVDTAYDALSEFLTEAYAYARAQRALPHSETKGRQATAAE